MNAAIKFATADGVRSSHN